MEGRLVTLNELLVGDRLFHIPVYQRGYAWEEKNLQDLWEDLYHLETSKKHYFGTVLLKDSGTTATVGFKAFKRLEVIDGQQRLTTVLVLLREIISQANADQVSELEEGYLKYQTHYKLNPLGSDGDFFRDFIIDRKEHLNEDAHTRSQKRLVAAKDFFKERIEEQEKKRQPAEFVEFLVELKRKIDELQLIQYLVNSDADAIRIFETVNDRGRPLSNLEKTKSFLMHTSYLGLEDEDDAIEARLEELNKCFSRMYRYFEDARRTKTLGRLTENDVQRYHFISYVSDNGDASEYMDRLKDDIRVRFTQDPNESVQYALNYVKDLEQVFFAVKDIVTTSRKQRNGDELGTLINKIFMVGRLGNIFPLMIASWLKFRKNSTHMTEILKLLERFTFRAYAVGNRRSDTGRTWLNSMAHKVHKGQWDYNNLISKLKEINNYYQNDDQFEKNLHSEDFYRDLTSGEIKYFLSEYEIHLGENARESLKLPQEELLSSSEYQVEHIWPQDTGKLKLSEDMGPLHKQNVHRLGNLTVTAWNSSLSNKPFEEKRLEYKKSSLRVQRDLADLSEWNPDAIREREDKIVEFALKRWSL